MITRNLETELIPACHRYGLDVVVYNPIAGGLFSGKIKSADMTPAEGRFSDVATAGKMYRGRYANSFFFLFLFLLGTWLLFTQIIYEDVMCTYMYMCTCIYID